MPTGAMRKHYHIFAPRGDKSPKNVPLPAAPWAWRFKGSPPWLTGVFPNWYSKQGLVRRR